MKVYVMIGEDCHIDTCVDVHASLDGAIRKAIQFLDTGARGGWDDRPKDPLAAGSASLTDAMLRSGWLWHLQTFDDGPSARVELAEVLP